MSTRDSVKAVALVFLNAMDDAAKVVARDDHTSQKFLEDLADMLKPDLKWAFRNGVWPDFEETDDTIPDFTDDSET